MGISGVTYEPFRSGQKPGGRSPSREQIREDMQILSGLSPNIRTYSVAGILAEAPAIADEFGLRVTLGVWISDDLRRNEVEIERAIDVANRSSNVVAVLVGNEVLLRDEASIDTLVPRLDFRYLHLRYQPFGFVFHPWYLAVTSLQLTFCLFGKVCLTKMQ
jgi:exo-beta-1,3-glucanase (GH17 family)